MISSGKAWWFIWFFFQAFFFFPQNDYDKYSKLDLKTDLYPYKKEINNYFNNGDRRKIQEIYKVINLLERNGKKEQAAFLLLVTGVAEYGINRDTTLALRNMKKAESIFEAQNNKKYLIRARVNLSSLYNVSIQTDKAIQVLLDAVKNSDGYPEEKFQANAQLGSVFKRAKNDVKAFEYLYKANTLYNQLTGPSVESKISYNENCRNLGVLHRNHKQYDSAEVYFLKALKGSEETQTGSQVASNLNSLGVMYQETGKIDLAIKTYEKAIEIKRGLKGRDGAVATSLNNLAEVYLENKQAEKAIKLLEEALSLSEKSKDLRVKLSVLEQFNKYFKIKPNPARQLVMLKEIVELQEKIYNSEISDQMSRLEAVYQNEKKSKEIAEEKLKNNTLQKDIEHKNRERNIFIVGTVLLLILLMVAFRMYLEVRKVNKVLNTKNEVINNQKTIVEHQNKEIIDSINYAQRIQQAILPSSEDFEKTVGGAFVFFKPKDIVSGDFYWCCEKNGYVFYAVVDCTGHGVPGGFMSMLATSFLSEIIIEKSIVEPAEILNNLKDKIVVSLKQKGVSGENRDGMDMNICRLDRNRNQLVVGAANNPVWIKRGEEIIVVKADKIPVGYSDAIDKKFTQQTIEIKTGDLIYSFTDGYADQFGGPAGKKFKYKQLLDLFISISGKSMEEQKEALASLFMTWKGALEQVDDVCVIGVKV